MLITGQFRGHNEGEKGWMIGSIRAKLDWDSQELMLPSEIKETLNAVIRGRIVYSKRHISSSPASEHEGPWPRKLLSLSLTSEAAWA